MLWLLRTLPLALAVGLAVGMSAAYLKASKRVAALESELRNARPAYACAPVLSAAEERGAKVMLAAMATFPAAVGTFAPPQPQAAAPSVACPAVKPPKPARAAPPLPFTYLGQMIDEAGLQVFVARGEASYIARGGEKIGQYQVDDVSEGAVTFTYLPTMTKQTLHIPIAHP